MRARVYGGTLPCPGINFTLLAGEGLTYSLTWENLLDTTTAVGFCKPLLVETSGLDIADPRMKAQTGNVISTICCMEVITLSQRSRDALRRC